MYQLQLNQPTNRVHIILSGSFDEAQAKKLFDEVSVRIQELPGKIQVLCDVSQLDTFDRSARKYYGCFMDLCHAHGTSKVIRIVTESGNDFGLNVMSCFHFPQTPVITCRTHEEAQKHTERLA
ncbi:hypothetical protein [Pontiella sp.]|uniref:hypothetical protein n=1 Tax=Pontiella sp. TaxID=2837462 RepID=UPI003567E6ED